MKCCSYSSAGFGLFPPSELPRAVLEPRRSMGKALPSKQGGMCPFPFLAVFPTRLNVPFPLCFETFWLSLVKQKHNCCRCCQGRVGLLPSHGSTTFELQFSFPLVPVHAWKKKTMEFIRCTSTNPFHSAPTTVLSKATAAHQSG